MLPWGSPSPKTAGSQEKQGERRTVEQENGCSEKEKTKEAKEEKEQITTRCFELPVAAPSTLAVELTGTEEDENIDGKGKEGEDGEEREWETCLGKGKDNDAARNYRRPP